MMLKIPSLNIKAQNFPLENELKAAFNHVLKSSQFILGQEVEKLENEIAALVGVRYAIGVSSGTDALLLALMTLGIGPGHEVIVPAFTFFATAGSVARSGATPVFVDISPIDFCIHVEEICRKITAKTKAIIPVHLYGQPAKMDQICSIARKHNIMVIEDAAQALGASCNNRSAGTIGDFGAYSFYPTKNFGGFGDGGMLVTNNQELANKARILRVHGMERTYYHKYIGANFRLDSIQAALLRVKLPYLPDYNKRRREIAAYYTEKLITFPYVDFTKPGKKNSSCKLLLPWVHEYNEPSWHQYTVLVPGKGKRNLLKSFLKEHGIESAVYYPLTLDQQDCFSYLLSSKDNLSIAHRIADECLSIPIYPELTQEQIDKILAALKSFLSSTTGQSDE
jgi:dTDP-4-amino-4,6-dideoxygalactose transaminase